MRKFILILFLFLRAIDAFSQADLQDSLVRQQQAANSFYNALYKQNSALSYTSPMGELGAPSRYILNGKLTTSYMILSSNYLPVSFSLNPDFTVRVRSEKSAGVRTPSFRLGGTLYLRLTPSITRYKYVEFSFTHHSNGQDGKPISADGTINTLNGNFSTNYLTSAYRFGHFSHNSYSFHHKIAIEWHKWFDYEPALLGQYGFTRVNYDFSFRVDQRLKEKWRLNTSISYAINRLDNELLFHPRKRLNAEFSANYSFPFMENVFLMATFGYYGEDPYNIYFKDKYAYARFGISSTFTKWKM